MDLLIAVAVGVFLLAGVSASGWWLLISWKRKRAARRWSNPAYAPPAFYPDVAAVPAHVFERAKLTDCCRHCGGGELHSVHSLGALLDRAGL